MIFQILDCQVILAQKLQFLLNKVVFFRKHTLFLFAHSKIISEKKHYLYQCY